MKLVVRRLGLYLPGRREKEGVQRKSLYFPKGSRTTPLGRPMNDPMELYFGRKRRR